MLHIIRRWVRTGFAPLALLILGVAGGCRLEPYWDGRPMAGPKNPTCYPENEWGGFYPTCWRQWPECAPRCKKESDQATSVEEGAPEKAPFSAETPVPEKPKAAPEAKKPDAKPAVKPAVPKPPAPAPLKTSSNDAMPETKPAEPTRNDAPAKEDEAAASPGNDGWLTVEEKPSEGGPTDSNWKPAVRQTSAGE